MSVSVVASLRSRRDRKLRHASAGMAQPFPGTGTFEDRAAVTQENNGNITVPAGCKLPLMQVSM